MQYHNCNSVFAGVPWYGRSLPFCNTSIHGLLTCSLTWHLNPLDSCNLWCLKRSLCSKQQRGKAWKCTPSSLVQMADLSTNEIQEMTSDSNSILGSEEQQSAKIKKKVAMWVGYVGTHYKGMLVSDVLFGSAVAENLQLIPFAPMRLNSPSLMIWVPHLQKS